MRAPARAARVELLTGGRGAPRGALVVLNGASAAEVRRAAACVDGAGERVLTVAVDGGLSSCRSAKLRPDLFVGDLDSVRRPPRDVPSERYARDKDFSDLAGALAAVRKRRVDFTVLAGLLGGRVDHEWSNLLELGRFAPRFAALLAPTRRGLVVVTASGCAIEAEPGRTVSLFAWSGPATVTLRGTRWTLRRRRLQPGSRGLSNLTEGRIELEVHAGVATLVLVPAER